MHRKQPLPVHSLDDFILTISDTEDNVPLLDNLEDEVDIEARQEGSDSSPGPPSTVAEQAQARGKKRKAGAIKSKKLKKIRVSGAADNAESDEIDSEFEFQSGDHEGIVEELEWGFMEASGFSTDKKKVEIDDIIQRRKKRDADGKVGGADTLVDEDKGKKEIDREPPDTSEDSDGEKDGGGGGDEDKTMADVWIGSDDEDLAADGFGGGADSPDDNGAAFDSEEDYEDDSESEVSIVNHPLDSALHASEFDAGSDDQAEQVHQNNFFAPESEVVSKVTETTLTTASFQSMNLSRPILRGLTAIGFTTPTLIQARTIPFALLGKDIVGGAVTGSGKTAAFIVPILERLLFRPKRVPTSRVLVLCPTRELAIQCYGVSVKLAAYTDIKFALTVGGLNLKAQEAELRGRPDVIIATPGRFIDHMRNTAGVAVDSIEILVMDEADRMLEDGFADELNEIISHIPRSRQTMLFSATMTDSVDQLIRLSLNKPIRLLIDNKNSTVATLVQEFIRVRPQREHLRLAMLVNLCRSVYRTRAIIFFRSKTFAHRVRVLFGLLDLKAAELHGSLTQEQRVKAMELFRSGAVDFLLATDLASRGLDIKNVSTVINFESPQNFPIYLHRVGRTARAGRSGRACTLAGESDRKVVKDAVKAAKQQGALVAARVLDAATIENIGREISSLEKEINEILAEEKEEKQLNEVEMQVRKGENLMKHKAEISSRPQRTWFQSQGEKKLAKEAMLEKLNSKILPEVGEGKGAKKKKLSTKIMKKLDSKGEVKEGNMYKKTKVNRLEGQRRGSGVKRLIQKVTVKQAKSKALKRHKAKKKGKMKMKK